MRSQKATRTKSSLYYEAFGMFIDKFTHVEIKVTDLLIHMTGIDKDIGRIILNGPSVATCFDFFDRIYAAKGRVMEPALASAIAHMRIINAARNDLVHAGPRLAPDGSVVVASKNGRRKGHGLQARKIEAEDLEAMIVDLAAIEVILVAAQMPRVENALDFFAEGGPTTWLYRPRAPIQKGRDASDPVQKKG